MVRDPFEPRDLCFELLTPPIGHISGRVVPLPPVVIGRLGDAHFLADVLDREPFGQVAVELLEQQATSWGSVAIAYVRPEHGVRMDTNFRWNSIWGAV